MTTEERAKKIVSDNVEHGYSRDGYDFVYCLNVDEDELAKDIAAAICEAQQDARRQAFREAAQMARRKADYYEKKSEDEETYDDGFNDGAFAIADSLYYKLDALAKGTNNLSTPPDAPPAANVIR